MYFIFQCENAGEKENEHMLMFTIITNHPLWHSNDATQLIIFDLRRTMDKQNSDVQFE